MKPVLLEIIFALPNMGALLFTPGPVSEHVNMEKSREENGSGMSKSFTILKIIAHQNTILIINQ